MAQHGLNQIINGTATMSYVSSQPPRQPSLPYITEVGNATTPQTVFQNESLVVPFPVQVPSRSVNQTFILNIEHFHAAYRWQLGNSSYPVAFEDNPPALFNSSSIPSPNSVSTLHDTWVDIIFNVSHGNQPGHPMHKHSNKYYVIGYGHTPFTYSSVAEAVEHIPEQFNFDNPQLRDTFSNPVAPGPLGTWLAIRYHVVML